MGWGEIMFKQSKILQSGWCVECRATLQIRKRCLAVLKSFLTAVSSREYLLEVFSFGAWNKSLRRFKPIRSV
jgi:hypothetical protein